MLTFLDSHSEFPDTSEALDEPNGLLAAGGDLHPDRLLQAYRRGIFPWYDPSQPVLWWTPDPRSILLPEELHVSRSLRRTLRKNHFRLSVDKHFAAVIHACAGERKDATGTWIDPSMERAYNRLHRMGVAHSIEVHDASGGPAGGLYGVAMGGAFFGESMFSWQTDASKVALVGLVDILRRGGFSLIDCQVESEHLNSLGARNISRLDFETRLAQTVDQVMITDIWHLPESCGGLL
jgi:leucyl/phenylalanyl-tRNA---protein transferase